MSPKRRNEILVGSFIVLSAALLLLLLFAMGSLDTFFEKTRTVDASFSDVQGLEQGDPVLLFGLKVGKVTAVELLPKEGTESASLRVSMKLPAKSYGYLRTDSTAYIDKNITGRLRVMIREGKGPPLPDGGTLQGRVPVDFNAVAARMEKVLGNAEEISAAVAVVVKEVESKADLALTLSKLAAFPEELREDLIPIRDQIQELLVVFKGLLDENRLDLRHSVANLKETTARAKDLTDRLLITPEKLERTLGELTNVAEQVAGLVGRSRSNVATILEDLSEMATNASQLTAEVKRRPWRLMYRPSAEELREIELYDAAWAFNLGSTELNRSLRSLMSEMEDSPDREAATDPDLQLAYEKVRESLRKQREAEEIFWEKLRGERD